MAKVQITFDRLKDINWMEDGAVVNEDRSMVDGEAPETGASGHSIHRGIARKSDDSRHGSHNSERNVERAEILSRARIIVQQNSRT